MNTPIDQARKLENVRYDIRGRILDKTEELEDQGHTILRLNVGNPAPFGFEAPDEIMMAMIRNLPTAQGYCDSRGLYSARTAVVQYYQTRGITDVTVDEIYLGNGVSELITLTMQALCNPEDEILIPAPDYPLWTASVSLAGGTPVHYLTDESQGWHRTSTIWKLGSRRAPEGLSSSIPTIRRAPSTRRRCCNASWI